MAYLTGGLRVIGVRYRRELSWDAGRGSAVLDGVAGRLGGVLPSRRRGPANVAVGELLGVPARVLLEAMVVAALGVAIAQTGAAARLVGDVVLKVGSARGAAAAGASAGRMPDFGQVPEHHAGIVTLCLVAVVAVADGERADLDEQVLVPGGEPPGSVSAGRSRVIGTGEGEAGWGGTAGFSASDGPGAAVSHGVPVAVGDRDAPGGSGVAGRCGSQIPGQVRVDGPDPGQLTGPVRPAGHGGLGDGEGDVPGESGRDHPGQRPGRRRGRRMGLGFAGAVRGAAGGPGVHAEQDVEERAGPQRVDTAVQAGLAQLLGPGGDALIGGQD